MRMAGAGIVGYSSAVEPSAKNYGNLGLNLSCGELLLGVKAPHSNQIQNQASI